MENQKQIISSERGEDLIIVNKKKYRFRRQRKDGLYRYMYIKYS